MKRPLTYLACPYTHADKAVMEKRFDCANRAAGRPMKLGMVVFSPISHSHPIAIANPSMPQCDFDYWMKFDEAFLCCSERLLVLMLDGWEESKGVAAEIAIAKEMGIPIEYLGP